jgi:hypothetical protein
MSLVIVPYWYYGVQFEILGCGFSLFVWVIVIVSYWYYGGQLEIFGCGSSLLVRVI